MTQDTIQKIINIQFNYNELVQGWQKASREIEANKKNLAELKQEYKNGEMTASEYNRALLEITSTTKALTAEKKAYEKEIQQNIKIETQATGSLNQLRANLQKMTAEYNALSAAAREGDVGKRMAADIKSQQEAVNEAEMALGNYRSQVGNYENAIRNALPFGNNFLMQLADSAQQAGGATNMIKGAASAIGALVKQAAAFIATPIGAALAAIYASYKLLSFQIGEVNDRIKENERLTYKQRESLTAAEAWNAAYTQTIDAMGESAIRTTSKLKTLWTQAKIYAKDLFKFGPAAKYIFMAQEKAAEELTGVYDTIVAKEQALNEKRRSSYEELATLEAKIADLRYKASDRQNYTDAQRKKYAEEAKDAIKEEYRIRKDIAQEEYELEELKASTTENSIATNDKLAKMRAGLISLEAQESNALKMIQRQLNEAAGKVEKTVPIAERIQKLLSNAQTQNLQKYTRMLAEWRITTGKEVAKMEPDIDKAMEETSKDIAKGLRSQLANQETEFRNRIMQAHIAGGDDAAQKELIAILTEQVDLYTRLKDAYEAAGYSAEQVDAKRLQSLQQLTQAEKQRVALEEQATQKSFQAASQLFGALNELGQAAGESAGLSAMLAIAQAAAAMGAALAKAFSTSATVWDAIAGAVAAIATITTVVTQIKALNSSAEEERSKYSYAQGGLVTGPGTGTSDSIPANLSNGEAVMTAQAVSDWGAMLSAMNVSSGGNAIEVGNLPRRGDGMRGMERMLERALMNMPAPVVAVTDINKGQRRVQVMDTIGRLGRKKYA